MTSRLTPTRIIALVVVLIVLLVLTLSRQAPREESAAAATGRAWVGATVWTGTEGGAVSDATLLVDDGRVRAVGPRDEIWLPPGTEVIDASGLYIVPGLINAHGHVGMAQGLRTGPEVHSVANVESQLRLYARYGITTVVSLGDEPPQAFEVRERMDPVNPGMARLYLSSGPVPAPETPEAAREYVREHGGAEVDWLKIRVDDQLGTVEAMPPEVYQAFIGAAHEHDEVVATHMVTLEHSKGLMRSGSDLLAHSVRDAEVDQELIELMLERQVCITPTLTREVSTYVYGERPEFFDDPFFLEHADMETVEALQRPEMQERFRGAAADWYREALEMAERNMLTLLRSGVRVAMGTDSGPPARFQGYFEHLEMAMMQAAGMTPEEVLVSATSVAADCMGIGESLGRLTPGRRADFLLLEADPLEDVKALRSLRTVYIGGEELP